MIMEFFGYVSGSKYRIMYTEMQKEVEKHHKNELKLEQELFDLKLKVKLEKQYGTYFRK